MDELRQMEAANSLTKVRPLREECPAAQAVHESMSAYHHPHTPGGSAGIAGGASGLAPAMSAACAYPRLSKEAAAIAKNLAMAKLHVKENWIKITHY